MPLQELETLPDTVLLGTSLCVGNVSSNENIHLDFFYKVRKAVVIVKYKPSISFGFLCLSVPAS